MIWSHVVTVITKAGHVPRDKVQLQEEAIPADSQFYEIIREREEMYAECVVSKKLRSGSLPPLELPIAEEGVNSSEVELSLPTSLGASNQVTYQQTRPNSVNEREMTEEKNYNQLVQKEKKS